MCYIFLVVKTERFIKDKLLFIKKMGMGKTLLKVAGIYLLLYFSFIGIKTSCDVRRDRREFYRNFRREMDVFREQFNGKNALDIAHMVNDLETAQKFVQYVLKGDSSADKSFGRHYGSIIPSLNLQIQNDLRADCADAAADISAMLYDDGFPPLLLTMYPTKRNEEGVLVGHAVFPYTLDKGGGPVTDRKKLQDVNRKWGCRGLNSLPPKFRLDELVNRLGYEHFSLYDLRLNKGARENPSTQDYLANTTEDLKQKESIIMFKDAGGIFKVVHEEPGKRHMPEFKITIYFY